MSLQEIVVLIHNGEYSRAISTLEWEASNQSRTLAERVEACKWLAECHLRLGEPKESGDWYLEAVKLILSQQVDSKTKAKEAIPLSEKALECYKQDGDTADVLVAARLRQYLLGLLK
jgi:hypothetical protein